ncbi:MAG: type II toxin-antitoxin system RelE/ParE family toxin [Pseudomonadota bacterium]
MKYEVVFSAQAEEQLAALYRYIANAATPQTALSYTENIVEYCEALEQFPHRGNPRDDILPGLRVTHYRKRTVIAFVVEAQRVSVLGIYYGGQDYESALSTEEE